MKEIDILRERESIYSLLSRLLMVEVDEDVIKLMKSNSAILELFPNFRNWELLKTVSNQKLIDEYLNVDFTNISLLHLIPYESFYKRDDGMVNSGGDNPTVTFYNDYDFRVDLDKARTISPDHIGIELEFMKLLIEAEIKAFESADINGVNEIREVELKFLKEHILSFAPLYLINLKNEAQTPLYYDLAEATMQFILDDYEFLKNSN